MKNTRILLLGFILLVSCAKNAENTTASSASSKAPKEICGFKTAEYNIVFDTIQPGATFGNLIQHQNLGKREVYDIVAAVKDSFDVRSIRIQKPFALVRSKDRYKKLEAFIYQPDRGTYYVIDFRDSLQAYTKTRPIKIKEKP